MGAWAGAIESVADAVADAVDEAGWNAARKKYGGSSFVDRVSSASGASGHFRFPDEATAKKIVSNFEDRAENIEKRRKLIDKALLSLRKKFAEDPASLGYSEDAVQSLARLRELNNSMHTYATNYAEKINRAIKAMHDRDEESAHGFGGRKGSVD